MSENISRRLFFWQSTAVVFSSCAYPRGLTQSWRRGDGEPTRETRPTEAVDTFTLRKFQSKQRRALHYRLHVPRSYEGRKSYPLVLWLHGSGGGAKIFPAGDRGGLWRVLGQRESQAKHESFIFVPMCPPGLSWANIGGAWPSTALRLVVDTLEALQAEFNIDRGRLCVIGASMGGYGTWDIIARYPSMFAAAVPMCGGGDVTKSALIARTPVWAFHGDQDEAVSVEESRRIIAAIRRDGGEPLYTEYAGVGHNCWDRAIAEPDLLPWIARQKRA